MSRFILFVLMLSATGCAGRWVRPGATQIDYANDKQYCALYAKAMNDNDTWSAGFTKGLKESECMKERGWAKENSEASHEQK